MATESAPGPSGLKDDPITVALRALVSGIYRECVGAYGAGDSGYEGQFEAEIQACTQAIRGAVEPWTEIRLKGDSMEVDQGK